MSCPNGSNSDSSLLHLFQYNFPTIHKVFGGLEKKKDSNCEINSIL